MSARGAMAVRAGLRGLAHLACTAALLGCAEREAGLLPVGEASGSAALQTRYVRRLHLDLSGALPGDAEIASDLAVLAASGNTAATRLALADALIARPAFASLFVGELENRAFAGDDAEGVFAFFCPIVQGFDPACAACAPAADCGGCDCPALTQLAAERASLLASIEDLASGAASTGQIERRYAATQIYRLSGGSTEGIAASLFDHFLGRPIDPDELRNASSLVIGTIIPGAPAGLLFHRHGETYDDLVDIVFTSEVYRDAAVDAVFARYLGRGASPAEQSAFASGLDPAAPDVRPVLRAVVSSREYFDQ